MVRLIIVRISMAMPLIVCQGTIVPRRRPSSTRRRCGIVDWRNIGNYHLANKKHSEAWVQTAMATGVSLASVQEGVTGLPSVRPMRQLAEGGVCWRSQEGVGVGGWLGIVWREGVGRKWALWVFRAGERAHLSGPTFGWVLAGRYCEPVRGRTRRLRQRCTRRHSPCSLSSVDSVSWWFAAATQLQRACYACYGGARRRDARPSSSKTPAVDCAISAGTGPVAGVFRNVPGTGEFAEKVASWLQRRKQRSAHADDFTKLASGGSHSGATIALKKTSLKIKKKRTWIFPLWRKNTQPPRLTRQNKTPTGCLINDSLHLFSNTAFKKE